MSTNNSAYERLPSQDVNDTLSISMEEMEPEIPTGTKPTLTSPSTSTHNQLPTLPSMINVHNVSRQEDLEQTQPQSNIQNLQIYLRKQCYKGSKWTSSLTFEGSTDKETYQEMDVLKFIGSPCYKDKKSGMLLQSLF